jgi:hypothetical protein
LRSTRARSPTKNASPPPPPLKTNQTAPRKLLDRSEYPVCDEASIAKYPAVLDAFTGEFSWGYDGKGTCTYDGPPRELAAGPGDKTPKCSAAERASSLAQEGGLVPDASGRFSWGWTGSESCWTENEAVEEEPAEEEAADANKD